MAKKYYWLKLKEDFFRQIAIKKLRKIAGGDTYTIIYLKLQLLSLKNEGKIYFEGIEENIADELALELDEDAENVKMTLLFLENHNLLEVSGSGGENEYTLPAVLACIGRESESAERMRRLRARQKQQQLPGGTNEETIKCDVASQCDVDVRKSDTDIDIDIDIKEEEEEEERQFGIKENISSITGINLKTQVGTEAVQRWAKKYPPEIIYLSAEITALHAQKPNIQYMEQVLQDWEKKGWNTAAKIKDGMARAKDRKRPRPKTGSSKKYEDDAEIYVSPASLERLREATENAEDTERVFAPDHPLS